MAKPPGKTKDGPMSCSENTNATVGDPLESLDDAVAAFGRKTGGFSVQNDLAHVFPLRLFSGFLWRG